MNNQKGIVSIREYIFYLGFSKISLRPMIPFFVIPQFLNNLRKNLYVLNVTIVNIFQRRVHRR